MATIIIVVKAWKQATSAYRRELGLAWLVVPAHSVSPACRPMNSSERAGSFKVKMRTGTVEEVPQRATATTLTPFMQL